jgi:hypothetical protein
MSAFCCSSGTIAKGYSFLTSIYGLLRSGLGFGMGNYSVGFSLIGTIGSFSLNFRSLALATRCVECSYLRHFLSVNWVGSPMTFMTFYSVALLTSSS